MKKVGQMMVFVLLLANLFSVASVFAMVAVDSAVQSAADPSSVNLVQTGSSDDRFDLRGREAPTGFKKKSAIMTVPVKSTLGASTGGYPVSIGGNKAYEYISSFTVEEKDGVYRIRVKVICPKLAAGFAGYGSTEEFVNVWIDWNGDYAWNPIECVLSKSTANYEKILSDSRILYFETTVKSNASASGSFKARAMLGYGYNPTDPTVYSWAWGDVRDCTVLLNCGEVKFGDGIGLSILGAIRNDNIDITQKPGCNPNIRPDNCIIAGHKSKLRLPPIILPTKVRNDIFASEAKVKIEFPGLAEGKKAKVLELSKAPTGKVYTILGIEYGLYYPVCGETIELDAYPITTNNGDYGKKTGTITLFDYDLLGSERVLKFDYYLFYERDAIVSGKPMWYHMWQQLDPALFEPFRFGYARDENGDIIENFVGATTPAYHYLAPSNPNLGDKSNVTWTFDLSLSEGAIRTGTEFSCHGITFLPKDYCIDAVFYTLRHELMHVDHKKRITHVEYAVTDGLGCAWKFADDDDGQWVNGEWKPGDGLVNSLEDEQHSYRNLRDSFNFSGAKYSNGKYVFGEFGTKEHQLYYEHGDEEFYVWCAGNGYKADEYYSQDWSYPGSQSPSATSSDLSKKVLLKSPQLQSSMDSDFIKSSQVISDAAWYVRHASSTDGIMLSTIAPSVKFVDIVETTQDFVTEGLSMDVVLDFESSDKYVVEAWLVDTNGTALAMASTKGEFLIGTNQVPVVFSPDVMAEIGRKYNGDFIIDEVRVIYPCDISCETAFGNNLKYVNAKTEVPVPTKPCLTGNYSDKDVDTGIEFQFESYLVEAGEYNILVSFDVGGFESYTVECVKTLVAGSSVISVTLPSEVVARNKMNLQMRVTNVTIVGQDNEDAVLRENVNWLLAKRDYESFLASESDVQILSSMSLNVSRNDDDGLANGIRLEFGVENNSLDKAMLYRVSADLCDTNGITLASVEEDLMFFDSSVYSLFFTAQSIRNAGVGGPYQVKNLTIRDLKSAAIIDECYRCPVISESISLDDFQRSLEFAGDVAVNTVRDDYGKVSGFKLNVPVYSPSAGEITATAVITDTAGNLLASCQSTKDCDVGLNPIEIPIRGSELRKQGVDGPYVVQKVVLRHSAFPENLCEKLFRIETERVTCDEFIASVGELVGGGEVFEIVTYGDAEWREDVSAHDGGVAVRSGTIENGGSSIMQSQLFGGGVLSFEWKTSCELAKEEGDRSEFLVDGEVVATSDGESTWKQVSVNLSGGKSHTVTWRYVKDGSGSAGEDCVWVSDIQFAAIADEETSDELLDESEYNWFYETTPVTFTESEPFEYNPVLTPENATCQIDICAEIGEVESSALLEEDVGDKQAAIAKVADAFGLDYAVLTPNGWTMVGNECLRSEADVGDKISVAFDYSKVPTMIKYVISGHTLTNADGVAWFECAVQKSALHNFVAKGEGVIDRWAGKYEVVNSDVQFVKDGSETELAANLDAFPNETFQVSGGGTLVIPGDKIPVGGVNRKLHVDSNSKVLFDLSGLGTLPSVTRLFNGVGGSFVIGDNIQLVVPGEGVERVSKLFVKDGNLEARVAERPIFEGNGSSDSAFTVNTGGDSSTVSASIGNAVEGFWYGLLTTGVFTSDFVLDPDSVKQCTGTGPLRLESSANVNSTSGFYRGSVSAEKP